MGANVMMRKCHIPANKYAWFMNTRPATSVQLLLQSEIEIDFYIFDALNFDLFEKQLPCDAKLRGRKSFIRESVHQIDVDGTWFTVLGNHHACNVTVLFEVVPIEVAPVVDIGLSDVEKNLFALAAFNFYRARHAEEAIDAARVKCEIEDRIRA